MVVINIFSYKGILRVEKGWVIFKIIRFEIILKVLIDKFSIEM